MTGKRPVRILILPSWYPPDGGGFFRDHAEALNNKDFEVHVLVNRIISFTGNSINEIICSRKKSRQIENGIFVSRRSTLKWPKFEEWNLRRWANKYIGHFEQYMMEYGLPDIMLVQGSLWAGVVAAKIKRKYHIPYILVEHRSRFTGYPDLPQEYFKPWYYKYLQSAFSQADRLVCVSASLKDKISEIGEVPAAGISVIPNLINTGFFSYLERANEKQPFVFLGVGLLRKVKGFDILLRAFASFLDQHDGEFFLRIAGAGPDLAILKKLAWQLGIYDNVTFLGKVSHERIRDEMQRSNVFVLASRFEAFGVVLIEALSTGCPVIATRSGGPESIVNEDNGYLVAAENEQELADAMGKMYLNYWNFNPELIRKEALETYNAESICEQYRILIRETIDEQSIIS